MRTRYKFLHRSADGLTYYWESTRTLPNDSRVEQIKCNVEWFWGTAARA